MNLLIQSTVLAACILLASCGALTSEHQRSKRQIGGTLGVGGKSIGGGIGHGFGAYDYNDYYGDYLGDYNYDYYDWVCTTNPPNCQLCNILGSECCDPAVDVNCFLPDTCLNNPCLSGGTCITTSTIDHQPDFICVCLPGLSGKYCQLTTDYFVGAQFFAPPPLPLPLPPMMPPMMPPQPAPYGNGPQPAPYGGQQGPAPYGSQQGPGPMMGGQQGPGPMMGGPMPPQGGLFGGAQPPLGGVMPYQRPGLPMNVGLGRGPLTAPRA